MAGLQIHAAGLAGLGQLVVQDGVWEGKRHGFAEFQELLRDLLVGRAVVPDPAGP